MQMNEFQAVIGSIDAESWEKNLPIGKLVAIEYGPLITRTFSYVARCKIVGDGGSRTVYAKIHRNLKDQPRDQFAAAVKKDYDIGMFWYELFEKSSQYHVVRPVLVDPEKSVTATEECRGKSVYDLIARYGTFFPLRGSLNNLKSSMRSVGGWLAYKNDVLTDSDGRYSLDEMVDYIDVRLKILSEDPRRHFPAGYRDRVLKYFDGRKAFITEEELTLSTSHSDFNPGNVMVDEHHVTVLDFGRLVKDSYLLDLVKLYHQLWLFTLKPQFRLPVVRELQEALLAGYGDPQMNRRLTMFQLLHIRNLITHMTLNTRFWLYTPVEKAYNRYVLWRELRELDTLIEN